MSSDAVLLTIGQVVGQLKTEFPDLSITKVRYLEDRGLLAPSRTAGRYRKYSGADVRRLRTILTLQRDQYLAPRGHSGAGGDTLGRAGPAVACVRPSRRRARSQA